MNLAEEEGEPQPIYISKKMTPEEKGEITQLIKQYKKVFAWTYEEMPGLAPNVITHHLHISPMAFPVKQHPRPFRPELEIQIKQEVERLLKAKFIKPIQHPNWLANIVPVKKKNGQIRCCIDYRDLNKACPKDEFPLPNIDTLVDATAGHQMFSFMDGFSGYNQIRMVGEDAEKTAFWTPMGNFYYEVMPFGLKNAGATYQRAMTAMFHDMLHDTVEDYVDDLVVKSKTRGSHLADLKRVFERCLKYNLKMNPLKCAFGVTAGKFLGFLVHRQGIDIDPGKARAIREMPRPSSVKQLKSFLGRVSYVRRFIPALAETMVPFADLLKKNARFNWKPEHEVAFEQIKSALSLTSTMIAPRPGQPLVMYITSTNKFVGALLAQEIDGQGKASLLYQ